MGPSPPSLEVVLVLGVQHGSGARSLGLGHGLGARNAGTEAWGLGPGIVPPPKGLEIAWIYGYPLKKGCFKG